MYYLQVQNGLGKKHEFWDDYVHSGCRVISKQEESPWPPIAKPPATESDIEAL